MPDTLDASLTEVRISELPEATQANATDLLEASQLTSGQYVSRKLALDHVTALIAGSSQIQDAIDGAIAAIPPASADWASITGKPATFPPTLPIAWTDVSGKPTSFPPNGAAGGDLFGSYPNPSVSPEVIDDRVAALLVAGTNVTLAYNDPLGTLTINSTASGGGGGTVTSTSVVPANGLAGSVATPTTTPAITLSTTVSGMLKGNGTAISAATGGTDYMRPADVSGAYLPLAGGTLTGPLVSNLATAPNQSAYRVTNYALSANNTTSAFRIDGTLNTTGQPDIFAINITDTSNSGGSAFVIKGGSTASNILVRADMAGDLQTSGWHNAMAQSGLPNNGAYYFAYYLGNGTGGNIGMFAGLGAPTVDRFGRYGSIYLDGASPGLPYYGNNASTGWDRLVGETSTQTLTNKTFAPASISPGSNTQVLTTVSGATAWAANAGGPPSGTAGGDLAGSYPNPTIKPSATNGQVLTTVAGASAWANAGVLQTVSFETGAVATGTTAIPIDDTIPQITEGTEFMTLAITPKSATSRLIIEANWVGSSSAAACTMVAALFQDATANALATVITRAETGTAQTTLSLRHAMTSGTTSATTFRLRVGPSGGTLTFNGFSGGRTFGGTSASSIVIQEVT